MPRKTVVLWQVRVALIFAVISYAFSLLGTMKWAQIAAVISAVIGVAIVFVYIPILFKGWRLRVDKNTVTVEWGVIIRMTHIMPFPRLIYMSSYSMPIGRLLGISGLVLKGARARLLLPEIENEKIKLIFELVKRSEQQ